MGKEKYTIERERERKRDREGENKRGRESLAHLLFSQVRASTNFPEREMHERDSHWSRKRKTVGMEKASKRET